VGVSGFKISESVLKNKVRSLVIVYRPIPGFSEISAQATENKRELAA